MQIPSPSAGLALLSLAPLAAAQQPVALVRTGDVLPGVGTVTGIERVLVDDHGEWVVLATTDNPAVEEVVLRDGSVWLRVGDPAPVVPGATLAAFDAFTWDGWGGLLWTARLRGSSAPAQGLFYGTGYSFPTGQPTASLGTGFPPGSTWASFDDVLFAHADFEGLLRGTILDPAGPGARSFVALAAEYGSIGVCCLVDLVALEGQVAPGLVETIAEVRTSAWSAAISPDAQQAFWSCDLDGSPSADGCIFHRQPGGQSVLVAREGAPSPVPGRVWGALESPSLDMAPQGRWTLRAELDPSDPASDGIVLLDGAKLVQEGDALPAIAPFRIDDLGAGRAQLTADGRVLWYGHWNDPSGPSEALFLADQVLVRAGTATVGGVPLVDLASGPHAFDCSPKGQFVLFRGTLLGGGEGAFLLDLGGMRPYCVSKFASAGCYPRLDWSGSPPSASAGSGFWLQATDVLNQVQGMFAYSARGPLAAPFLGGTLCVAPPVRRLPVGSTGGGGPAGKYCTGSLALDFNAWVATGSDPRLVAGQDVYVQAWYRDPGYAPPDDVGLTRALEFQLLP